MKKLWVVGKIKSEKKWREWEFIGVFESKRTAIKTCRTPDHFIGSVVLNKDEGDVTLPEWPGWSYPMRENPPKDAA